MLENTTFKLYFFVRFQCKNKAQKNKYKFMKNNVQIWESSTKINKQNPKCEPPGNLIHQPDPSMIETISPLWTKTKLTLNLVNPIANRERDHKSPLMASLKRWNFCRLHRTLQPLKPKMKCYPRSFSFIATMLPSCDADVKEVCNIDHQNRGVYSYIYFNWSPILGKEIYNWASLDLW